MLILHLRWILFYLSQWYVLHTTIDNTFVERDVLIEPQMKCIIAKEIHAFYHVSVGHLLRNLPKVVLMPLHKLNK